MIYSGWIVDGIEMNDRFTGGNGGNRKIFTIPLVISITRITAERIRKLYNLPLSMAIPCITHNIQ